MKYQLAIFDLDGTVLDTLQDLADSLNYALARQNMPLRTLDEVRSFVGNGMGLLIQRGVPAGTAPELQAEVLRCFHAYYKEHCADTTRPYDGILELLHTLRQQGILTAVASNKADYGVQELCSRYFPGCFHLTVGEREGVRKKPSPDAVLEILRTLDIPRESAVYIGDSDVDIDTAKNAGIDCISVDWGFRSREFLLAHGAGQIVSTAEALKKLLTEE